jgi:serine/threonine protein kinase/tetratricopeptide (TPR) repeat protein
MPSETPNEASVFDNARKIESNADRDAYLIEACQGDAALRDRVDQLLSAFARQESSEPFSPFLRDRVDKLLPDFAAESQSLEPPAAEFEATLLTDGSGGNLAASLDAGFAPAFTDDQAIVLGDGNHSVLKMLAQTLDDVPRVALRETEVEGADPITRPKSPEMPGMPDRNSDSRYQLQGEIARGGMGAVLKGRDTDLGRDLAIKVLLDQHKDKPDVVRRFVEEAQIGGQLQHPGIAPVYELGQFSDQRPFFAMKLVKGQTLSKLLADRENANAERSRFIGIFEQICQTMAYAHSRGVIHRDLKPANIMVGAFGEVQVMDWGLAKVLQVGGVADEKNAQVLNQDQSIIQTLRSGVGSDVPAFGSTGSNTLMGSVMGTPAYMPPEQALGKVDRLDERSDVFGLGAILCEILTGRPPYVGTDGTAVYRQALRGKLDDCMARLDGCGADEDLIALAKRCLELEPADRPRDAGVLAAKITEYLESVETKLRKTELERASEAARAVEARKRMRVTMALAASVLLTFIVAGGGWVWLEQQAAGRRRSATARVYTALSDAEVHQRLANSAELEVQVSELEKAVASARNAVEIVEQEALESSVGSRARTLLADLQTRAARAEGIAEQARKDRRFQDSLELIRLSQADGWSHEITLETAQGDNERPAGEEGMEFGGTETAPQPMVFHLIDGSSAADRYEDVYRKAGLDLGKLDVTQAAAMIRSSAIREIQIAAIDNWARAITRPESASPAGPSDHRGGGVSRQKLLAIANAADESEWRRTVRAALEVGDMSKLTQLAATDEARSQPPVLIAWLGAALRDGGETEASVSVLLHAQRKSPGDFWLNYELSKSLGKKNEHVEGLGFARTALGIRPESIGASMALAASMSGGQRHEEAAALFRTLIAKNPQLVEAHTGLAAAHASLKQWDEAVAAYRAALELEPRNAELRGSLAITLKVAGRVKEGLAECRKAIEQDPDNALVHFNLGRLLHGEMIDGISQNQAAAAAYRKAIELDPKDARPYCSLGFLKCNAINDKQGGIDDLRTAIQLDPKFAAAYTNLAQFGKRLPPEERVALARKAIELDPGSSGAYTTLSLVLRDQGLSEEAATAVRTATFIDPQNPLARCVLGDELARQDRLDEAIVEFRRAVELEPTGAWFFLRLGESLIDQGNSGEALNVLARAYRPNHINNDIQSRFKTAMRCAIGQLVEQEKLDAVADGFRIVLEQNQDSLEIVDFLVTLLRDGGMADELAASRQITHMVPNNAAARARVSRELQKQGLLDEAVAECRKAIEFAPEWEEPYELLAVLFKAQGNDEQIVAYRKVLESFPNVSKVRNRFARTLVTTPGADGKYQHVAEAIQWARTASELEPGNGAIWNTLGITLYRDGQWQACVDALRKSRELNAAEPSNGLVLAMAQWRLGNRDQALTSYAKALTLRSRTLADSKLLDLFAEARKVLERAGLEQLVESDPNSSLAASELADLLLESSPEGSEAPQLPEGEKRRVAARQIADPWERLAAAHHILGEEEQLQKLVARHPLAEVGVADMHLLNQQWQQAIAIDDALVVTGTANSRVFSNRAAAHAALQQFDLASADWRRAVRETPELNRAAYESFRSANRVREAAEFGLLAMNQTPTDVNLWEKLSGIVLLADDEAAWREHSTRLAKHWAGTTNHETAQMVCRACLLVPGGVDLKELPQLQLIVPENSTTNSKRLAEFWTTRALVAYRGADANGALDFSRKSQELGPYSGTSALNMAVQALAYHKLGELDQAQSTLKFAERELARSQGYVKDGKGSTWPHPAELLVREAVTLIRGKPPQ